MNKIEKKKGFKEMIKSHKLMSVMICMVLLSVGVATAAWIMYAETGATFSVIGGGNSNLIVSAGLMDIEFPVDEKESIIQPVVIQNNNGVFNTSFQAGVMITNFNEDCDPNGDITFEYLDQNNNTIVHDDNVTISPGENTFFVNITSNSIRACDANYTLLLNWSEI